MAFSTSNIHHLIKRDGPWTNEKEFYDTLHTYATKLDSMDGSLLDNELNKLACLKAAKEVFAPKEAKVAD